MSDYTGPLAKPAKPGQHKAMYDALEGKVPGLDHRPATAFLNGDPDFNWDGYEAKPNDACYRCGKVAGVTVVPLAGWLCKRCAVEIP